MATSTTELSPTSEAFIVAVKRRMESIDIRQVDLADRLGMSKSQVSQTLSGGTGNFTTSTMDRIAEALECRDAVQLFSKSGLR